VLLILLGVLINFVRNTESKFESANLFGLLLKLVGGRLKSLVALLIDFCADFNYAADAQLIRINQLCIGFFGLWRY